MSTGERIQSRNVFLTSKFNLVIFFAYIALFIAQGILVTASRTSKDRYDYDTVIAVLVTEMIKLLMAVAIYLKDKSITHLPNDIWINRKLLMLYLVPSGLYALYNNLAYVNLKAYDPTTYYILLQFRVAVTGVIYQILFKRQLSRRQWLSLFILMTGCIVKNFGSISTFDSFFSSNLLLIIIQIFCSCFAGVYNEYLLKGNASKVDIMIQNIFMYLDSILVNVMFIISRDFGQKAFTLHSFNGLMKDIVLIMMINNALCGIVTSFFLKNLNSIWKAFASALELVFTPILCYYFFDINIDIYTILSVAIVCYATHLYLNSNDSTQARQQSVSTGSTEKMIV